MLLCDYAEALNGKLYISGGGWDRVRAVQPISCSVAVMFIVPWTASNVKHSFNLFLQGQDGDAIPDEEGDAIAMDGSFEVGRPPGVQPGSDLKSPMAFRVEGLDLGTGGYRFVLEVDGTEIASTPFYVHRVGG